MNHGAKENFFKVVMTISIPISICISYIYLHTCMHTAYNISMRHTAIECNIMLSMLYYALIC